jgi:hypothetical protein
MSHATIKACAGGIFAGAADAYMLQSKGVPLNSVTLPRCATFGALVGGSFLVADMIAPNMASSHGGNTPFMSVKTLEHRLIEVSLGSATALSANKYFFKASTADLMSQLATVAVADVFGEYVADYFTSQPLSYLA